MKKQKTLTIVVCCYNSTKTVLDTLKSIRIHKYPDVDVFLVDDGSKDNLKNCVQAYLDLYPNNVHYFWKENGNWGSCLNFAIRNAKSKYLCVLDSDDLYNTEAFKKVIKILRHIRKNTDMVFCNYEFHFLNEKKKGIQPIEVSHSIKDIKYVPIKKMPLYHLITIHSTFFSLDILRKIKPLPEHVAYTDNLLIYEALLQAKNVAYINRKIYLYKYCIRQGKQTISIETSIKKYADLEIVLKNALTIPFDINSRKQIHIAKKFINLIYYWLAQILSKDYSRPSDEKIKLMKSYSNKIKKLENKLCLGHRLEGTLYPMLKNPTSSTFNLIRSACGLFRGGFVKATEYDKTTKKWARAIGKIRRKNERQKNKKK